MKTPTKDGGQKDLPFGTRHSLDPLACLSALQKCIRRGMEREAMEFACELLNTPEQRFCTMVTKRLEIISHEDIDTQTQPGIVPFVKAACDQARAWYDVKKLGHSRMAVGNAIRLMCRAQKSREGDHFQAAVGLANLFGRLVPTIPDWAYDGHTKKGAAQGRGLEYFRAESSKLVPAPPKDAYEDEAYRVWELQEERKRAARAKPNNMFPDEDE